MKKKPEPKPLVFKYLTQAVAFAKKSPLYFFGGVILVIFVWSSLISYMRAQEILPEAAEARKPAKPLVIKKGDSLLWLGMELTELTGALRKEFNIESNIRGIFVVNEGKDLAMTYGMKTGDVIVSVSRQAVPNAREFINKANNVHFRAGILLEVYRFGQKLYVSIPFAYQYGPLAGPNKGGWQLGSPLVDQALPYGPLVR